MDSKYLINISENSPTIIYNRTVFLIQANRQ